MEDIVNKLGSEFSTANFLSIPEVALLLKYFKEQGQTGGPHSHFEKIYQYVKRFNRFPSNEIATQIRNMLQENNFSEIEIALLMNLCPSTAEEAKSLIPDLDRFDREEDLARFLDEIARLRNLQ